MQPTLLKDLPWSECPWDNPYTGNARRTVISALHPTEDRQWEMRISVDTVRWKCGGDRPGLAEFKNVLPEVLKNPAAILIGLERDEGPMEWGLAYCGTPKMRYHKMGDNDFELGPVPPGQVFVAFVDQYREVYDWRWEDCNPHDPVVPHDSSEGRFKCRAR